MQIFQWDVQKCRVSPAWGWQVRLRAWGKLSPQLIFKIPCHAQPPCCCHKSPEAMRGQGNRWVFRLNLYGMFSYSLYFCLFSPFLPLSFLLLPSSSILLHSLERFKRLQYVFPHLTSYFPSFLKESQTKNPKCSLSCP